MMRNTMHNLYIISAVICIFVLTSITPCHADNNISDGNIYAAIVRELHTDMTAKGGFERRQVNSSGLLSVGQVPNEFTTTFLTEICLKGQVPDTIMTTMSAVNAGPTYSGTNDVLLFMKKDAEGGCFEILGCCYKTYKAADGRWFVTEESMHGDTVFCANGKELFTHADKLGDAVWGLDAFKFADFVVDRYYTPEENTILLDDSMSDRAIPHGMVDLGLSVLWSDVNLGAAVAEEYGSYSAWGETKEKPFFDEESYQWYGSTKDEITKYNSDEHYGTVDRKSILDSDDDIVQQTWGEAWRIPTWNEWKELMDNCTCSWTTRNGVGGILFVSRKNGNCIFLPAGGVWDGDGKHTNVVNECLYWSADSYNRYLAQAMMCLQQRGRPDWAGICRHYGLNIRPVWDPSMNE